MVQTAADVMSQYLEDTEKSWPSLDQMPIFDKAMVDAALVVMITDIIYPCLAGVQSK